MVDLQLANPAAALRTYLRESSVLASVDYVGTNQRIFVDFPLDRENKLSVPAFEEMIVILPGRGGQGDLGISIQEERMDIMCYGRDRTRCYNIWAAVDNYLIPRFERIGSSFIRNGCQINFIIREGGPNRLTDPDAANWPYTLGTYLVLYNGQVRV